MRSADSDICVGFLVEPNQWDKLQQLKCELHNGTDRERDYGHRLWLVLASALALTEADLAKPSKQ